MKQVEMTREPVELYKILKFEGLASSGGEAKMLIDDGQVRVNGSIETRKRMKIVNGDIIEFQDNQIQMVFVNHSASLESRTATPETQTIEIPRSETPQSEAPQSETNTLSDKPAEGIDS